MPDVFRTDADSRCECIEDSGCNSIDIQLHTDMDSKTAELTREWAFCCPTQADHYASELEVEFSTKDRPSLSGYEYSITTEDNQVSLEVSTRWVSDSRTGDIAVGQIAAILDHLYDIAAAVDLEQTANMAYYQYQELDEKMMEQQ